MMADKPTTLPEWASTEETDPVSGQLNRVEPPTDRKESGWTRREIPPRQWWNWLLWRIWQWLKWVDAGTASATASTIMERDSNGRSKVAHPSANADAANRGYVDIGDADTLNSAQSYADTGDADTLNSAQSYADTGDADTLNSAQSYADTGDADTLNSAQSYTDNAVDDLSGVTDVPTARDNLGISNDDIKWLSKAIGEYYVVDDSLTGVDVPPTDNSAFRFVKLTAGEAGSGQYNEGVLTSESVTGSVPLVVATAVIDDSDSPMNGQTVHLLNTENRYLMPGESPGTVANDQMQQITGLAGPFNTYNDSGASGAGALSAISPVSLDSNIAEGSNNDKAYNIDLDSANSPDARTGNHTNVKHMQATYYMRIA